MLYNERMNFVKEYVNHWAGFDECSPIENGFECWGCSALFIVDNFNIHFGFYDPDGHKLAEYLLNAETGIAVLGIETSRPAHSPTCSEDSSGRKNTLHSSTNQLWFVWITVMIECIAICQILWKIL